MIPARHVVLAALLLVLAAAAQGRVAHAIAIRHAQPDFLLVTLSCVAVLLGPTRGVWLGVWSGLLTVALLPITPGSFLASRTLAGAWAGWLQGSVIQNSVWTPPLCALSTTLLAQGAYVLMAPTHHLRAWAVMVAGQCAYNAVLSFPLYAGLRKVGVGRRREDPFALHSA